jgi:hypothetical protein
MIEERGKKKDGLENSTWSFINYGLSTNAILPIRDSKIPLKS